MRINQYIAACGICSRRKAENLVRAGEITINGHVVTDLSTQIESTDDVRYKGKKIRPEEQKYVYAFHKPKGVTVSLEDPKQGGLLTDYIQDLPVRVVPVGRLDKDSTGLLLLTNDGDLVHRLTHPSFSKQKTYEVELDQPPTQEALQKFSTGVYLDGKKTKRCKVVLLRKNHVRVILEEGRYRQIRRMWESLGYRVTMLHRTEMDGILLGRQPVGTIRELNAQEKKMLYEN